MPGQNCWAKANIATWRSWGGEEEIEGEKVEKVRVVRCLKFEIDQLYCLKRRRICLVACFWICSS